LGLEPPKYGAGSVSTVSSLVEDLLQKKMSQIAERKAQLEEVGIYTATPTELLDWLTQPLTEEPEYYEDVYFKLREKYMPVIGVNSEGVQQYDETHKEILDQILERFDEYEDNYVYNKD